ncbi:ATP-binding cassette domain-containing protein [Euzebya tangerina]|uniref:ATP-binding cassette domain-containing protein n=1 Tax=Euzebya tangerina TaxID=591198 RepID=UPI00196AAD7A|nr:ATP-binding cassette domain-containing protein [Euzebya tangerina]
MTKTYVGAASPAVDAVSVAVAPGEIYGLLGPNGSGKSTFVKMLVTLLAPTAGQAHVGGISVTHEPRLVRSLIGVTLQDVGVDPVQSCHELLVAQGRVSGLARGPARDRAEELLNALGLVDKIAARVSTLSGGQRRRLDLALSLVHRPQVVFLDEPTTGLDPSSRRALWAEVRRLRDTGTTILLTTQYLEEADELADRIGILKAGSLVAEGTARQLKERRGQHQVVLDLPDLDAALLVLDLDVAQRNDRQLIIDVEDAERSAVQILGRLTSAGVQVDRVRTITPTLDDVFVAMTATDSERAA